MKKSLLSLILGCSVLLGYSQKGCVPDPQYSGGGIYPDTVTFNSTPAFVGQSYNQLITIITPVDTAVTVAPLGQITATFEQVELISVTGLPSFLDYTCDPPTCIFPGGSTKCADLFSTVPLSTSDVGVYPIVFETIATLSAPFIPDVDCTFVVDGYVLEIIDNTTSVIHQFNNQTFELKSPFPNPVENQAKIQFISGESDDIIFSVYNLLGKQIYLRKIRATRGINVIDINTSSYSEGIYLYSINNGHQVLTKRMVVKN